MKVAIIHYWLVGMRGGERVLEEIAALYPDADIFTHVLDRRRLSPALASRRVTETAIARLPFARRAYKAYLGFMPGALEALDLSGYDLVIASESGPAQGVVLPPRARMLTYCHSPMRYIWDQHHAYVASLPAPLRPAFRLVARRMRQWDFAVAQRPDRIIANSAFVAARIRRFWGREAEVLPPPVDLSRFGATAGARSQDYLFVSELTAYKRADLAIEAFRGMDRRLIVAGDGPDKARLMGGAPPNVRFVGRLTDTALAQVYGSARALIFPAEEDFGLVPVEAMASGCPVIAYGSGGATETVVAEKTGLFFPDQTVASLQAALDRFEVDAGAITVAACRKRAEDFGADRFRSAFRSAVDDLLAAPAMAQRR
jgi:glycosyltransferase involved in cell wall biosynthesis